MRSKPTRLKPASEWRKQLFRLFALLLIPIGIFLPKLAAQHPEFIENVFSRSVYPVISHAIGAVFSIVPFSVAEWLLYLSVLAIVVSVIAGLIRLFMKKIHISAFIGIFISIAIAGGALLNIFYFAWGFNYSRLTLAQTLDLDVHARDTAELSELCIALAQTANGLRTQVSEDENGVFTFNEGVQDVFARIPDAYVRMQESTGYSFGTVYAPKTVFASTGLSYAGISGIYFPFTAECNVNVNQPALYLASSAAHEAAHFAGIARENEANFVSYLVCIFSDDVRFQYSGTVMALVHAGNQLSKSDPEAYRALWDTYCDGLVRDLRDYSAYIRTYEGPVNETMTEVNDQYLKYNQQTSGVKSYGEMVDLLLAYYSSAA